MQPTGPARADSPAIAISQYKHTRWTVDDGAPNPIFSLAQSSDGYIWLGTRDGVFRFDGVQFEEIPPDPKSEVKSGAQKLVTARDGSVWAGYREGGIAVYRNGAFRDAGLKRWPKPEGFLMAMAQTADDAIWAASYQPDAPFARYQDGKWQRFGAEQGLLDSPPVSLLAAKSGALWVTTESAFAVMQPRATRFERAAVPFKGFAALSQDAGGRIWLSDPRGSRVIEPAPLKPDAHRFTYPSTDFVRARQALFDQKGNLWTADGATGVWMTQMPDPAGARSLADAAAQVGRFGLEDGLASNNVTAILQDREGSIWVGSLLGLDQFRLGSVIVEPALTKLAPWGYAVFGASDGTVYIIQAGSIYRVRPAHRPEPFLKRSDLSQAICEAPDGSIWFAFKSHMSHFTKNTWSRLDLPVKSAHIYSCSVDRNSNLWISIDKIGTFVYRDHHWDKAFTNYAEIARPLLAGAAGGIVSYSQDGLITCNDHAKCTTIAIKQPSIIGGTQVLYQGASYLLAGGPMGLVRMTGTHTDELTADRFPILRGIVGIVQTPSNETWLIADAGIVRLSTAALERAFADPGAKLVPLVLSTRDGLPGIAIRSGLRDAVRGGDGRLWFVTSAGVVWVDPSRLPRNPMPPKVSIRSLRAGGVTYRDPVKITLPAGTLSGQIDFAALSLTIPQRNQVRYQLEGSDEGWVDPGIRRQMFFSNLSPGVYRLHVIASNNDGIWNREGASVEFEIPPTFIQSIWFKLLCVLAMSAVLWMAYTIRLRQITDRMQATQEVRLAERERIARELHDTLLQGFQGLILRFQALADRLPADTPWRETLYRELDQADAVLIEGRDRVGDVRATDSTGDLAQLFTAIAAALKSDTRMDFELMVEGEQRPLHPMVHQEVRRVGEEAIRNAFRHSRGNSVHVKIAYDRRVFRLTVSDNGVGLPDDVGSQGIKPGHFGLPGMRERANTIGGVLSIVSRKDEGTEILLSVPARAAYVARRSWWRRPHRTQAAASSVAS